MMFDNYHSFFGFWVLGILILLVIALLVASDASKYGENGFLWGFVVFIMPMMGLLIYAIVRSGWIARTSPPAQTVTRTAPLSYNPPSYNPVTPSSQEVPTEVSYCVSCGSPNPKGATYCNKCGTKIPGGV